jgi:hypothetical protein
VLVGTDIEVFLGPLSSRHLEDDCALVLLKSARVVLLSSF